MNIKIVTKVPEIHNVPLSEIIINENKSMIEFDDVAEQHWRINFKTIFAWKVTASDYFNTSTFFIKEAFIDGIYHKYLLEDIESAWINELGKYNSNGGTLDKAHHYILPLGEEIVEVIAWDNYTLERL